MKSHVSSLRKEYLQSSLDEKDVNPNPIVQFEKWFDEALNSNILEPNAMVLSTVDEADQSSQRTVLLKGFGEDGFTFYSNYRSNKGLQMGLNPKVSILFPWYQLQRQIIIKGAVTKTSRAQSEEYFHSRPISSQLGAHVSKQSEKLGSRAELAERLENAEIEFKDKEIPLPENWGGYLIRPTSIEFWQGRASRLHDRILFEKNNDSWEIFRLSP